MKKYIFTYLIILFSVVVFSQNNDGYVVLKYPDGTKSSEGVLKNGKPEGLWKAYHKNGTLKSIGKWKNNLPDSIWKFYNDSAQLILSVEYKEGKKHGLRVQYTEDGRIEENFLNDVKNGLTKIYDKSGKLIEVIPFVNGLEQGTGYVFSSVDGRIVKITVYQNGFIRSIEYINNFDYDNRKHGLWKWFYEPQDSSFSKPLTVKLEGKFKKGKKHGYFKYYDKKGNLVKTEKYENDSLVENPDELVVLDIKKEYYPDGKIRIEAGFKDGKPEGWWKKFDEEGNIEEAKIYFKGQLIAEGKLDKEGLKTGYWKYFYPDGKLKSEGNYSKGKKTAF